MWTALDLLGPTPPYIFSGVILGICCLVVLLLVWALNRRWWRMRAVRIATLVLFIASVLSIGVWAIALPNHWVALAWFASSVAALLIASTAALSIALLMSGIVLTLDQLLRRPDAASPNLVRIDQKRRAFVTTVAAAFPTVAVASATGGVALSMQRVRFREIPLRFADLPPDLAGLRVLHLSDPHLGLYSDLDDFERAMENAESLRPDLVLMTGDVSDDLSMLPGALRMIDALKPRLGSFVSLGNHEYYMGIKQVRSIIDAGPVPLLKDNGATLRVGAAELYLGGVDDPVWALPEGSREVTLRNSLMRVLDGAPSDAFYLMMSHRPEGFDFAAAAHLHLTISGHYHGGQIGWDERSVFESVFPARYLWGHYQRNASQLYTSAGMGHWFPFRFNCPREALVYILKRGSPDAAP